MIRRSGVVIKKWVGSKQTRFSLSLSLSASLSLCLSLSLPLSLSLSLPLSLSAFLCLCLSLSLSLFFLLIDGHISIVVNWFRSRTLRIIVAR